MFTVPHCAGGRSAELRGAAGGALTQMSSLEVSSNTIRLSLGERPVFLPEKLMSAPDEASTAPSYLMASS